METESFTFEMTNKEFFFLTQMLGLSKIAGYSDPYKGYLMEELEGEYSEIQAELVNKGWLKMKQGQENKENQENHEKQEKKANYTDMNEALALCLAITGSSQVVQLSKQVVDGEDYTGFLYFHPKLVVEVIYGESGEVQITPVADPLGTMDALRGFFPLTLRSNRTFKQTLTECNWAHWKGLGKEKQLALLQSQGGSNLDHTEAERVVQAFAERERIGSMIFWNARGEAWEHEGYHYVQHGEELYLARETKLDVDTETKMELAAYNPDLIWDRLVKFAAQFDLVVEGA
ncbi:hypothetical protein J2Z32_000008 [Paenibacillus turicensis]|uniref:Uncharacterized protein n=1 Tax=Paenibacillus turicensis TaxID=160487 RepID=A0ABS4FLD4_9BACL|nr:hypothetical protein [Paenibacillus turicensis]MBP1903396.1 hypothetical protein [Paenibacillus turicensis]